MGLQILFQVDVGEIPLDDTFKNFWRVDKVSPEIRDFAAHICKGVVGNLKEVDSIVKKYTKNWEIGRINNIDRNILRIAIYELLFCRDVPYKVVINEAIEIGKKYGTLESGKFINGVLDGVAKERRSKEHAVGSKQKE